MTTASLPLNLSTKQGLQIFLQAIDDPTARRGLSGTALPPAAKQLVEMADDPIVTGAAVSLGKKVLRHRHDVAIGQAVTNDAYVHQVQAEGNLIKTQLEAKYPEGMALLANYAKLQQQSRLFAGDTTDATVSFAANAYTIANAGVYVNVAVATNVVLAAEVAVAVGLVVS